MSIYQRVKKSLLHNKQTRENGNYNCIPWLKLKRLSDIIPGVEKKKIYMVTASSKIGKSKLAEFLFIYEPLRFIKQFKPKNIKLKIFYFSLEQSKEEKIQELLSNRIFTHTGKIISPSKMESMFDNYILDDETAKKLDDLDQEFAEFEKTVTYIDDIRNPFGIYKYMRDFFQKNGTVHEKEIIIDGNKEKVFDYYEPNDPDLYTIVITDHLSILTPEKGSSLHESMTKFSSVYCINLRNMYGATIVNVQQQAADQEKQQFNQITGQTNIDKLKPTPDGLGDNKLTGRDCNLLIGLFAPHRYGVKSYNGYDLERLQNNYRELSILFNRNGSADLTTDLYFNGAVNVFEELPVVMDEKAYQQVEQLRKNQV